MNDTKRLRFIKDSAASEDFFGGHKRVAKALSYLLDDPTVRLIALLGPWGSGKSTVVKLAEIAIDGDASHTGKKPKFFVFDAWLHQSDSPRRALIESIVAFLQKNNVCPEGLWKDELETIQRRSEKQEVQTTPSLTAWGFVVGLSLLLVPLGVRLADSPTIIDLGRFGFLYANVVGVLITLLPIFLVCLNYASWRHTLNPLNKVFWTKINWQTHKKGRADRTLASMFFNKAVERTTNKITKTPEPTSFEFQRLYKTIMQSVSDRGEKLVVIIDNLDRIPAEEAIECWSTIRSLLVSDSSGDEIGPRPWVVVPLDIGAIGRIFKGSDVTDSEDQARAFVEKTFDAVLHVTPPVTSDWQNYLRDKISFATCETLSDSDQHTAVRIYEIATHIQPSANSTTPRKINSYINKIISILLQWDGDLPFYAVCYHAAFAEGIQTFSNLIGDSAPGASVMGAIDVDWRQHVAAIHFGVPTGKALQILMQPEISAAIFNENQSRFLELSESPGFEIVLGNMMHEYPTPPADWVIYSTAALLDKVESNTFRVAETWRTLLALTHSSTARNGRVLSAAAGIKALVQRGKTPIAQHLLSILGKYGPEALKGGGAAWFEEAWACDPGAPDRLNIPKGLIVPGDADFYLEVIDAAIAKNAVENWYELLAQLNPGTPRSQIIEILAQQGPESNFSDQWHSRIIYLPHVTGTWDYAPIYAAAENSLRTESTDTNLTNAVRALTSKSTAKSIFSALGSEGILANRLYGAAQAKRATEAGAILLALARYYPAIDPSMHTGNSAEGVALARRLDTIAIDIGDLAAAIVDTLLVQGGGTALPQLVLMARQEISWRPLISEVLKRIVETPYLEWYQAINFLEVSHAMLQVSDLSTVNIIMKKLLKEPDFEKALSELTDHTNFFVTANAILSPDLKPEIVGKISSRFGDMDQAWWTEQFGNTTEALGALEKISKIDAGFTLDQPFFAAVDEYVNKVTQSGNNYPQDGHPNWQEMLSWMDEDRRMVLDQNIVDRMRGIPQDVASCALYVFGSEILRRGVFDRDADRNVRGIVLPILSAAEEAPLSDLKDTAELLRPSITQAAKSTRAEIGRIAREKIDQGVHAPILQFLLDTWGITPTKQPKARGKPKDTSPGETES